MVGLGALWMIDAALQAQAPHFSGSWWRDQEAQAAMAEPGWLAHVVIAAASAVASHAAVANAGFVALEALIGVCLFAGGRATRPALAVSAVFAVTVWVAGEGAGMLLSGFALLEAGAPGPALMYAALALVAWPGKDRDPPGRSAVWVWLTVWLGGAALQFQVAYPRGFVLRANLEEAASGSPGWLRQVAMSAAAVSARHPAEVAIGLAIVEAAVGVAILRAPAAAAVAGIAVSSVFWVVGQDLGGLLAPGATDVGTAPLVALLAACCWLPWRRPAAPERVAAREGPAAREGAPLRVTAGRGGPAPAAPEAVRTSTAPAP